MTKWAPWPAVIERWGAVDGGPASPAEIAERERKRAPQLTLRRARLADAAGEEQLIIEASCHARQPREIPWSAWQAMYTPAIRELLERHQHVVADLDGIVVGFALARARCLHTVYVKKDFRGNGYGKHLVAAVLGSPGPISSIMTTADMLTPSFKAWCGRQSIRYTIATEGARCASEP